MQRQKGWPPVLPQRKLDMRKKKHHDAVMLLVNQSKAERGELGGCRHDYLGELGFWKSKAAFAIPAVLVTVAPSPQLCSCALFYSPSVFTDCS